MLATSPKSRDVKLLKRASFLNSWQAESHATKLPKSMWLSLEAVFNNVEKVPLVYKH